MMINGDVKYVHNLIKKKQKIANFVKLRKIKNQICNLKQKVIKNMFKN